MSQQFPARLGRTGLLALPVAGVLLLAGCSGGGDSGGTGSAGADTGFTVMVAQSNDADVYWANFAKTYTDETGIPIDVIPYPGDAYTTQVTTQLQAGNAADMMITSPGTGQPISTVTLADAGFLEPLDDTSASLILPDTESQFGSDGNVYGQPAALTPVGFVYNAAGGEDVGIPEYPATYEDMLAACATARDGGKVFTVLAGSAPPNTGLLSMIIAATRVYSETPDWNQQRTDGKVTFADSGWRDVFDDILEMNSAGCFQDGVAGGTFDSITQGVGGGTALTAAVPGSAAASISAATNLDLTVQAFPPAQGEDNRVIAAADYAWSINAKASDSAKSAAQAFLDWAAEPAQAQSFAELSGFVPITGVETSTLQPSYQAIGSLLEAGDTVDIPLATFPNSSVYDAIGTGVQGLLTGQTTVDQLLATLDAAWDS